MKNQKILIRRRIIKKREKNTHTHTPWGTATTALQTKHKQTPTPVLSSDSK